MVLKVTYPHKGVCPIPFANDSSDSEEEMQEGEVSCPGAPYNYSIKNGWEKIICEDENVACVARNSVCGHLFEWTNQLAPHEVKGIIYIKCGQALHEPGCWDNNKLCFLAVMSGCLPGDIPVNNWEGPPTFNVLNQIGVLVLSSADLGSKLAVEYCAESCYRDGRPLIFMSAYDKVSKLGFRVPIGPFSKFYKAPSACFDKGKYVQNGLSRKGDFMVQNKHVLGMYAFDWFFRKFKKLHGVEIACNILVHISLSDVTGVFPAHRQRFRTSPVINKENKQSRMGIITQVHDHEGNRLWEYRMGNGMVVMMNPVNFSASGQSTVYMLRYGFDFDDMVDVQEVVADEEDD